MRSHASKPERNSLSVPCKLAGRDVLSHPRIVFRLGAGQDFLKSQVVSKRVPFQRVHKSERAIIKNKSEGIDD